MLTEQLLQFIWQFQYFNKNNLSISSGETLQILFPGSYNTNQGPDFSNAKIKIGNTIWAGNIEIHLNTSDWNLHKHSEDKNYGNVILHVVWHHDKRIDDANGNELPTLTLQPLVSTLMLQHYHHLMASQDFVPCQSFLPVLSEIGWQSWLERLLVERLQNRSGVIFQKLYASENHWEAMFWQLLARNFGMPVNADAFENIAQTIPVSVLAKHKNRIQQLEALLLGQAGLLNETSDDAYVLLLQREYRFLKTKYSLQESPIKPQFLRMRPANFPTVRLAQMAMLIQQSDHLFSKILETKESKDVMLLLNVTANDFWHYHYHLHATTGYQPKVLGTQMVDNIMINTIIPVVFAYGLFHNNQLYKDKAVDWFMQIKGEMNTIIKSWKSFGVHADSAMQTQGLIQLKKHYCDIKKCLSCSVGNKILKGT